MFNSWIIRGVSDNDVGGRGLLVGDNNHAILCVLNTDARVITYAQIESEKSELFERHLKGVLI